MALSFDSLLSLLCGEDAEWDNEVASSNFPEDKFETLKFIELAGLTQFSVHDDEMISLLVQKETEYIPQEDYVERYRNHALDVTAREEAISWIHKVQAHYNFRSLTAYLSVNYLDRFLSSYKFLQGLDWSLELLSVACLSLAAKMEETQVPPLLLDLQVGDAKFGSEVRTIYSMEVLILTTLEWRLCSITPFHFIDYLLYRLQGTSIVPQELISRTIAFIFNTSRVIDFLVHRPSSIAAAAVMCACDEVLQPESADYKEAILSSDAFNKERIISCYNLMRELWMGFSCSPNKIPSGTPQSQIGVLDAAACVSYEGTVNTNSSKKRKVSDATLYRAEDQRW